MVTHAYTILDYPDWDIKLPNIIHIHKSILDYLHYTSYFCFPNNAYTISNLFRIWAKIYQSLLKISRVYTLSSTSFRQSSKRLAMMALLCVLNASRLFTTLLPKNVAPSSRVGS